jgi:hypothetical protein
MLNTTIVAILVVLIVFLLLSLFLRPVNKERFSEVDLPIYSENGKLCLDYVTGKKYTLPLVTDENDKLYSLYSQDQSLLKDPKVIHKVEDKCDIDKCTTFKLYCATTCGVSRLVIMNENGLIAWSSQYFPSDELELTLNETNKTLTIHAHNFTHDIALIPW